MTPCRERWELKIHRPGAQRENKELLLESHRLGAQNPPPKPARESSFLMRLKHDFWGILEVEKHTETEGSLEQKWKTKRGREIEDSFTPILRFLTWILFLSSQLFFVFV